MTQLANHAAEWRLKRQRITHAFHGSVLPVVRRRHLRNGHGSTPIAVRDVTIVSRNELPSVVAHIQQLASDYEDSEKPLAAIHAQHNDITATERAIYARIVDARSKASPLIEEVIARQTAGDRDGARKVLHGKCAACIHRVARGNQSTNRFSGNAKPAGRRRGSPGQYRFPVDDGRVDLGGLCDRCRVPFVVVRNIVQSLGADPCGLIEFADAIRYGDLLRRADLRAGDTGSVSHEIATGNAPARAGTQGRKDAALQRWPGGQGGRALLRRGSEEIKLREDFEAHSKSVVYASSWQSMSQ
ncbi:hypothetical protein [Paraburkholderia kirstenboschensis]|uniref:hypothetical protein n=1 Tax=Paraburkholderia kirstenboschensis TaxID=1245436 RepID=UPI000FFC46A1|nr:hypothetical protein [Paraburkholderia kirstenboschensis]